MQNLGGKTKVYYGNMEVTNGELDSLIPYNNRKHVNLGSTLQPLIFILLYYKQYFVVKFFSTLTYYYLYQIPSLAWDVANKLCLLCVK